MVLKDWSPIRQGETPLVKSIELFTTPIEIALVVQEVYLYTIFGKKWVNFTL